MDEFPSLETARLILRQPSPSDGDAVLAIYSRSEVTGVCDVPTLTNCDQARRVLSVFEDEFERGLGIKWAITRKESDYLVGLCGLGWYRHNASALLSYDLNPQFWHRGIMTEALRATLTFAFGQGAVNRVTATTVMGNQASRRLLQRLRFQEEGVLRDWGYWGGQFKDLRCFSLLKRDFPSSGLAKCEAALNPLGSSARPGDHHGLQKTLARQRLRVESVPAAREAGTRDTRPA